MKRIILILSLFLFGLKTFSQNLIHDGSFEDTTNLWENRGMSGSLTIACPTWYDAVDGFADFYNIELGKQNLIYHKSFQGVPFNGVPSNFFTAYRNPRTGIGYSGLNYYIDNVFDDGYVCKTGEIMGTTLKDKLKKNKCYKVKIFVGAGFYRTPYAVNAIDVRFDSIKLEYYDNTVYDTINEYCRCSYVPDFSTSESFYPQLSTSWDAEYFIDSVGWQKLEFEYIANGFEKYIHIGLLRGNLCDSLVTLELPMTDTVNNFGWFTSAYLFFDDVSVYPCDAPEYPANIGIKDTCINKGSPIVLGGLPKEEYLYWWYDSHDSLISRQSSITVYPTQDTSFVLVQKDFKFDETRDTVHIKVGNCLPLPPDYSGYDFAIYPNPNYGNFQVRFNTAVPEGAVLELYDLLGRKLAEYPLSGSGNIANINGIEVASAIYYATVVVPNSFRKSVKMVIMK